MVNLSALLCLFFRPSEFGLTYQLVWEMVLKASVKNLKFNTGEGVGSESAIQHFTASFPELVI